MVGQATNQGQAEWLCRQYAEAPLPQVELTEYMGEDPAGLVWRVRKTPSYWNVEGWPRAMLAQSEDDVAFP